MTLDVHVSGLRDFRLNRNRALEAPIPSRVRLPKHLLPLVKLLEDLLVSEEVVISSVR